MSRGSFDWTDSDWRSASGNGSAKPAGTSSWLRMRDWLPYIWFRCLYRVREVAHSFIVVLLAHWWDCHPGRGLRAYGLPIFRKHPTGAIRIGRNAILRSAEWSNTAGLNRRCVISASRNAKIVIGDDCGFSGTVIAAAESITIGNRVFCGVNCTILDNDRHAIDPASRAENEHGGSSAIVVEDDVWLGMNVVVLKGCRIGKGTVVGANSVVTRSLPAGVIAAGAPARVIRELHEGVEASG
jgi:acetyltransferase-like isoleucine patch superfamily enzyme